MKPHITVHTVADAQTLPYATKMKEVAKDLALKQQFIDFRFYEKPSARTSSWGHGDGLRLVFSMLPHDGRINVIADSDTCVLSTGWDLMVRNVLIVRKVHCFGPAYADIGEFGAGDGPVQTYKGTPNLTWVALHPDVDWTSFDPQREDDTMEISTPEMSQTFGLPVGHTLLRDVGWQLPMFLRDRGLTSLALDRERKVLKDLPDYNEEWSFENVPFLAHQRGSSKHPFMSEPHSGPFYRRIDDHVGHMKARR